MPIDVPNPDRIVMSQKERDVLKVLHAVLRRERSQAEAAHLLGLSTRQVRRIQRRLEAGGDAALVHGLRGKPSNHQPDHELQQAVLDAYRQRYPDFGPTFAAEKLALEGLHVHPQTLRRWLLAEGLWQRQRRRDPHRTRRPRRACFGELVQLDASDHDWLEGRGEELILISMIDDATNYTLARFYPEGTSRTHLDILGRWLRRLGRPVALYTDRHSIFEAQDKGKATAEGETQFGRACRELDIDLIRAHSPQAKGRIERSFHTAQDRWLKELRLAGATTCVEANEVLERLLPAHNRRFMKAARQSSDAHRELGPGHDLTAILSIQETRVVGNDYTIRFYNRIYQLLKPIYPGQRRGKVVVELRLDGTMAIRFGSHYLNYREVPAEGAVLGGSAPQTPRSLAPGGPTPGADEEGPASVEESGPSGVQPTGGRSGRTPAEPYPPDGADEDSKTGGKRPAEDHPWRKPFKRKR